MGRKKNQQTRLGSNEKKVADAIVSALKNYKLFEVDKKRGEVAFNNLVKDYLRQLTEYNFRSDNIPQIQLVDEKWRPEFYVEHAGSSNTLCCVECKKLIDSNGPKYRFTEGLSQALVYTQTYKRVILLYLDFTSTGIYKRKFGKGNSIESTFAKFLRENNRIHIVVLRPKTT